MNTIGIIVLVAVVIYIVEKVREINMRLKILDVRYRIMEILVRFPENEKVDFQWLYNHHFGDMQIDDYKKIVKFGRKHGLNLPLLTMEEEQEKIDKKKAKGN